MQIGIEGLQEAQRDNLRMVQALRPSTGIGQAVRDATVYLHRYAVILTHVQTGALRASHRMDFSFYATEAEGVIHIDDAARNPVTGARPSVYGIEEESRGGSHAFYGLTFEGHAETAGSIAVDTLMRLL